MTAVRWTVPAALIALLCGLLPAAASAVQLGGAKALAPSLRQLAKPKVRALPRHAQERRLGDLGIAASGPGSLIREDGRVLVETQFEVGAISRLPALRAAGAEIVAASKPYQRVTASVPPADLHELARVPGVTSVRPVRAPVLRAPPEACRGSVVTEGIGQLQVEPARERIEEELGEAPKEGEGLTIGVLSDSFDQATEAVSGGPIATNASRDIINKDLPGEANQCAGQSEPVANGRLYEFEEGDEPPFDEGRAMLQIIHDIVPKARLSFTSAFNGELAFAEGIEELAEPGIGRPKADVIVDDVGYFEEPFFQDGPVAVAIEKVVGEGVTYLTAAGNDNLLNAEKSEIASWEAPEFRDSSSCPAAVRALSGLNASHCMDFNPEPGVVDRTFGLEVEPGETLTVDLQWAEPWEEVNTNLDAFLLDAEGRLLTLATERNLETQVPAEILQWENEGAAEKTVQLVINRRSGLSSPLLKFILLENGRGVSATEYPRSGGGDVVGPTVYGHAGAAAAITLGAVHFNKAPEATREPEPYSSRGPVTHYFGPYEGSTPAAPLLPPEVISKPDAAATDCGRTTFFAALSSPGIWRFCGTSAAAPHAAGLAALAIEASKAAGGTPTPEDIAEALTGTAVPVGSTGAEFGPCAVGGGLLEAEGVVQAMRGLVTPVTPAECEAPESGGSVFVAPGNWGLETPPTPEPEEEKKPPTPQPPVNPPPIQPPEEAKPAPATKILTHPQKIVRTGRALARVVFRFGSQPGGASFRCQYDGSPWRNCSATVARWFGLGPHVVRVQAKLHGVFDPTPVVYRFRIARSR
ncbi:MAG TPA: S8 family serine peptidase [Solirubrobacterales bacterium]